MEEPTGSSEPNRDEETQLEWKDLKGYEADNTFVLHVTEFFTKELSLES